MRQPLGYMNEIYTCFSKLLKLFFSNDRVVLHNKRERGLVVEIKGGDFSSPLPAFNHVLTSEQPFSPS